MNIPGGLVDALIQPSADLSKDIAEAVWEVTLDGSILENIPGISLILAFKEGILAVRDRAFAAKVVRFLLGVSGMRASDRARVVEDLAGTADKREKLGELLLDKLGRADPFHNPEMLAKLFIAVSRGHIAPPHRKCSWVRTLLHRTILVKTSSHP
ncbi:hypothetical protein LL967_19375 [Xanthomonas campestris pv. zinniae]|nr:hypothetical protein [Xanthomonas campestris pv. zinniae]